MHSPRDTLFTGALADIPQLDLPVRPAARQSCGLDLPVVVINLLHRTDRWEAISTRMAAAGLDALTRAPAVNGHALPAAAMSRLLDPRQSLPLGPPECHLSLTPPAVGCFLSHLGIWRWMIDTGIPRVLILEDDACPVDDYDAGDFRSLVASLTPQHQLVFPGCLIMDGLAEAAIRPQRLARLFYFNGTFAYLITQQACRFLLDHILPLRAHIDHQLSSLFLAYRQDFEVYYAHPAFFAPDWSLRSDCYVPLDDAASADQRLGDLLGGARRTLLGEGHRLLPPAGD